MARRALYDAILSGCAREGLTSIEAARRAGCSPSVVSQFIRRTGITFAFGRPMTLAEDESEAKRGPLCDLTPVQRRDCRMLMKRGEFTREEAVAIVTRPKVKIRFWTPRAVQPGTSEHRA